MSEFKAGDKIRHKVSGNVYTVAEQLTPYDVRIDGYGFTVKSEYFQLVKEEEMTQQFKNMKFDVAAIAKEIGVKHEEASRIIQEALFELGCKWQSWGTNTAHTKGSWLMVRCNKNITFDHFDSAPELTKHKIKQTFSIVPVEQEEFVELNGKKYNKKELEAALSMLKPVVE